MSSNDDLERLPDTMSQGLPLSPLVYQAVDDDRLSPERSPSTLGDNTFRPQLVPMEQLDPFMTTFDEMSPNRMIPLSPQSIDNQVHSQMIRMPADLISQLEIQNMSKVRSSGEDNIAASESEIANTTELNKTVDNAIDGDPNTQRVIPPPMPILPKQLPDFEAPKCPLEHI